MGKQPLQSADNEAGNPETEEPSSDRDVMAQKVTEQLSEALMEAFQPALAKKDHPHEELIDDDDGIARLLVVDEDEDRRDVLEIIFLNAGYDVLRAHTDRSALEVISTEHVDVIVCDIEMPTVHSGAFLKGVRKSSPSRDVPVVVLSRSAEDQEKTKLNSVYPAVDHVDKDQRRAGLLQKVEEILDRE